MNKLSCLVLVAAAIAATPAFAQSSQAAPIASADASFAAPKRVKRLGTRLDVVVVHGAVDPDKQRWSQSGKGTPVLPTISESAFLDEPESLDGSAASAE